MAKTDLTAQRLRELLHYDPETGLFTHASKRRGVPQVGQQAGSLNKALGYVEISVDGRKYYGHRLAWFWVHGVWPPAQVDHINHQRSDNRLSNLRLATKTENMQNLRGPHPRSTHGFLGASFHRPSGTYTAQLRVNGTRVYLGCFATPEAAHEAYMAAKRKLHPFGTI